MDTWKLVLRKWFDVLKGVSASSCKHVAIEWVVTTDGRGLKYCPKNLRGDRANAPRWKAGFEQNTQFKHHQQ